ncbi:MAG TPA: hypothetical protein VMR52_08335 [Dehalococcoidia bacterium]|nr:hypothetical protein [Dehalococcoidia bacterium]
MGIFDKILGKDKEKAHATERTSVVSEPECPHTALSPHWDSPADMGKEELATYTCESCGAVFAFAEAREIMDRPPAVLLAAGRSPEPYDDESKS